MKKALPAVLLVAGLGIGIAGYSLRAQVSPFQWLFGGGEEEQQQEEVAPEDALSPDANEEEIVDDMSEDVIPPNDYADDFGEHEITVSMDGKVTDSYPFTFLTDEEMEAFMEEASVDPEELGYKQTASFQLQAQLNKGGPVCNNKNKTAEKSIKGGPASSKENAKKRLEAACTLATDFAPEKCDAPCKDGGVVRKITGEVGYKEDKTNKKQPWVAAGKCTATRKCGDGTGTPDNPGPAAPAPAPAPAPVPPAPAPAPAPAAPAGPDCSKPQTTPAARAECCKKDGITGDPNTLPPGTNTNVSLGCAAKECTMLSDTLPLDQIKACCMGSATVTPADKKICCDKAGTDTDGCKTSIDICSGVLPGPFPLPIPVPSSLPQAALCCQSAPTSEAMQSGCCSFLANSNGCKKDVVPKK